MNSAGAAKSGKKASPSNISNIGTNILRLIMALFLLQTIKRPLSIQSNPYSSENFPLFSAETSGLSLNSGAT
jgi:hypothetical protein